LCWEQLDVVFLKNQSEISPKIPLDPISSKHNVVFNTAVKWMPKRNISNAATHKALIYHDQPNTHRQRRIFMHTISRKDPNKYSNILKSQRLKRITENTMKIMG
jgi:hypothetical protein